MQVFCGSNMKKENNSLLDGVVLIGGFLALRKIQSLENEKKILQNMLAQKNWENTLLKSQLAQKEEENRQLKAERKDTPKF